MTIQVTAFRWVPPFAQGYVKDLRVRWALEEAGLVYEVVLIDPRVQASPDYRRWQPFGQVPAYRDGEVELFESGAIVLHIAARSQKLTPADAAGPAKVSAWVIAALNSIEPHAQNFIQFADRVGDRAGETWATTHLAQLEAVLTGRLAALSAWLGERPYLEHRFTAGDLMMTMVLRELVDSGVLARFPMLDAYRQRCEGRPAFVKSLEAQLQVFRDNAPA